MEIDNLEWHGLYNESWQGEIVPEAFSHPAKYGRAMIRQIYKHMTERGYICPGDHIVDPFGGVGLGALDAMRHGLHWHGCELEPRFVELGNQNLGLWQARYSGWFADWGTAVLHQGDSRQLVQTIGAANGCISSPPYGDAVSHEQLNGIDWEKAGRPDRVRPSANRHNPMTADMMIYGRTPGNLGNMQVSAAVGSPPYAATFRGQRDSRTKEERELIAGVRLGGGQINHDRDYGTTAGQLALLSEDNTADNFWTAARAIAEQVYTILKPGGYAAWVTGDFVRNGQRVHFGQQWLELCQAVGFEPVEWIVCWKTEYRGTQLDIFGNGHARQVDRVSFFRRLANEKNPDAAILNEDVIIVRKGNWQA